MTARSIAFVTAKGATRGKVRIYVNGRLVRTLDLRASSTSTRYIAWQVSSATAVKRTIKLVVVGTPGRPRVDLDALVVIR